MHSFRTYFLQMRPIQPFSVEDAIGLTAAQARARFRPAPPRSNHERWLRSVADEFKQTRGKKNNVVDILSRFKPVESGVES
jgi:hypothetical protein